MGKCKQFGGFFVIFVDRSTDIFGFEIGPQIESLVVNKGIVGVPVGIGTPGIDPVKVPGIVDGVGLFVKPVFAPGGTHIVHLDPGDEAQRFSLASSGGGDDFVESVHKFGMFQTAELYRLIVVLAVSGKFLGPLFFHLFKRNINELGKLLAACRAETAPSCIVIGLPVCPETIGTCQIFPDIRNGAFEEEGALFINSRRTGGTLHFTFVLIAQVAVFVCFRATFGGTYTESVGNEVEFRSDIPDSLFTPDRVGSSAAVDDPADTGSIVHLCTLFKGLGRLEIVVNAP